MKPRSPKSGKATKTKARPDDNGQARYLIKIEKS